MLSSPVKTVVLTSKENFVWDSMTEIVPHLERLWKESECSDTHKVDVINIDNLNLSSFFYLLLQANNIVFTVFTVKLAKIAKAIRLDLHLDARYIFHLHNQATIACWPLYEWGMGDVLRESDIFISTCSRDKNALKLCFYNPTVEVIPFGLSTIPGLELKSNSFKSNAGDKITLAYVGRISVQKNLHTLLYSLYLFKKKKPDINFSLDIYGKEDNLGNPNMELDFLNYLDYLKKLAELFHLQKIVTFKGFYSREKLYQELTVKKHIIVSTSIHSDENFGMAIFRSLCLGAQAVITNWGGHADFKKNFPNQVHYVKAYESSYGPFVSPFDFIKSLKEAIETYDNIILPSLPKIYQDKTLSEKYKALSTSKYDNFNILKRTDLAVKIHHNRNMFLQRSSKGCKIFHSYGDENASLFFVAYGMESRCDMFYREHEKLYIPPWVAVESDMITIKCPHRGQIQIEKKATKSIVNILDAYEMAHQISFECAKELWQRGFIFFDSSLT